MPSTVAIAALGLLLGVQHAADADHVAAVSTIVAREPSVARAARLGAIWGLGHTVTILLLGGAIILFRVVIPPRVGLALEFGVALMLVWLGLRNLLRQGRAAPHVHGARPFAIGIVHGLAGSAAVALLVLGTIGDPRLGVAYLLVFGLGTVGGMLAVTAAMALPLTWMAARVVGFERWVRVGSGVLSLAVGAMLGHEVGIAQGLFTSHPAWSPR